MENFKQCVVCQAWTKHKVVYEKWGYPILQCRDCHLGSTSTGNGFNPALLYDKSYFQGSQRDGYADYQGSERTLRVEFRRALSELRCHGSTGGKLLEVGCAYGFFLLEAQQYFHCTGVEISEAAVQFCQSRGLDVYCGVVDEELLYHQAPFDAVVMLDVIEHLPNPTETLSLLHQGLRVGGLIMISTGDWDSILARLMGQHWRLMTPPQHLFYFSQRTLTELLAKTGFRVIHWERPWKVVPVSLMIYQLSRRLGFSISFLESLSSVGMPVNLFDAIRLVARKEKRI